MAVIGTNSAVGKIEVHQVTSLQDLRSRIVRCDQALSKHSADIGTCRSEVNSALREQQTMKENLKEHIHRVEAEVGGTKTAHAILLVKTVLKEGWNTEKHLFYSISKF